MAKSSPILGTFIDRAPGKMYALGPGGVIVAVTKTWLRHLGYRREDVIGRLSTEFLNAESRQRVQKLYMPLLLRTGVVEDVSLTFVRKNGTEVDVLLSATSALDRHGELLEAVALLKNLTDQRRAEHALFENERRLRKLTDSIPTLISYVDRDLVYRFVNATYERMLKRPRDTIVGQSVESIIGSKQFAVSKRHYAKVFAGQTARMEWDAVFNQQHYHLVSNLTPDTDESGVVQGIFIFARDITQAPLSLTAEDALDDRVLRAQKLESLGVLAGGIAHDFNNLLTGILTNAAVLETKAGLAGDDLVALGDIRQAAQRAAELTNQLLAYAGQRKVVARATDLRAVVRDTAHLVRAGVSKRISLRLSRGDAPVVMGDATQLGQIVMNLMTNAADAIGGDDGEVRLHVDFADIDETGVPGTVVGVALPAGRYARVAVKDTGSGIPAETIARMFEPFYSTRGTGRGLGLSATVGVVKVHGGALSVESEPGVGTTVSLFLPLTTRQVTPVTPLFEEPLTPGGRILLIDDEPYVRRAARRLLEVNGYEVVEAVDGVDGLQQYEEHGADISLVLADLTMPRMGGFEVAERIHELDSNAKIVLMSGYSEADLATEGERRLPFVSKPLQPDVLLGAIQKALQS